jgi:hypothetical protein
MGSLITISSMSARLWFIKQENTFPFLSKWRLRLAEAQRPCWEREKDVHASWTLKPDSEKNDKAIVNCSQLLYGVVLVRKMISAVVVEGITILVNNFDLSDF